MSDTLFTGDSVQDPDTKKILDEMEAENKSTAEDDKSEEEDKKEAPTGESDDQPTDDKFSEEKSDEDDSESSEDKSTHKVDESTQDSEEDDEGVKPKFETRSPHYMSLSKYNKAKERWQAKEAELQSQIDDLKSQSASSSPDVQDEASKLAEQEGLDPDLVGKFVKVVTTVVGKKFGTPDDVRKEIEALRVQQKEREQDKLFNSELEAFTQKFPDAAKLKDKLYNLAFSETPITIDGRTFPSYSLPIRTLYEFIGGKEETAPKKKSVESSQSGRSGRKPAQDFDENADISAMSNEEFEAWSNKMAKSQGSNLKINRR